MGDIIYLDEIRIKKEIVKAESALVRARTLKAQGVHVPNDILGRLQQIINQLEKKLEKVVTNEEY
tara:strand:+ start:2599 stop:2793 length:195 start_codon:yes stop_codon:yes gene_type:complete